MAKKSLCEKALSLSKGMGSLGNLDNQNMVAWMERCLGHRSVCGNYIRLLLGVGERDAQLAVDVHWVLFLDRLYRHNCNSYFSTPFLVLNSY